MGRPRYQQPSVLRTKAKRPQWYVRVMVEVLVDRGQIGRTEKSIYLGFCDEITKQDAKRLRDEKLKTINNTPFVIQSQVAFKDLTEAYRTTHIPGLKPSSRTGYAHCLDKYILRTFDKLRLFEVDAIKVQQWVYKMESAGLSQRTRQKAVSVLRSVFDAAEEWGYFQGRNPCKKTKLGGGGDVSDLRPLEPEEALRLLKALDGDEPLHSMVEVALFCDLRISEIRGLTWGSIDETRNIIEVRQSRSQQDECAGPKSTHGHRKLDLGGLKLSRPQGAGPNDLVWPDGSYFGLQKRLRRVAKSVGIEFRGFGFHTLRRSYADWRDRLRISSKPDADMVRDMGHARSSMTARYVTGTRTGIVEQLQEFVFFSAKPGVSGEERMPN